MLPNVAGAGACWWPMDFMDFSSTDRLPTRGRCNRERNSREVGLEGGGRLPLMRVSARMINQGRFVLSLCGALFSKNVHTPPQFRNSVGSLFILPTPHSNSKQAGSVLGTATMRGAVQCAQTHEVRPTTPHVKDATRGLASATAPLGIYHTCVGNNLLLSRVHLGHPPHPNSQQIWNVALLLPTAWPGHGQDHVSKGCTQAGAAYSSLTLFLGRTFSWLWPPAAWALPGAGCQWCRAAQARGKQC